MDDAVYNCIKARLLAKALPPGQLLQLGALADESKVSITPVREALTRLATERLLTYIPKKGFFTKTPSAAELLGLYRVSRAILSSVSKRERRAAESIGKSSRSPCLLKHREPQHLAQDVSELFLDITLQSDMSGAADIVKNINDRLYQARLIECEIIADVCEEISNIRSTYESAEWEELRQALRRYHDRRLRMIGEICKELYFRPFSSGGK